MFCRVLTMNVVFYDYNFLAQEWLRYVNKKGVSFQFYFTLEIKKPVVYQENHLPLEILICCKQVNF